MSSPTARALLALEHISGKPGITGQDLATRLGVSDRAARRYVGLLREAGIPVESTSGPYGGYRIGRGARLPPLMFSPEEALGLVMAAAKGHQADRSAGGTDAARGDAVDRAVGKIVRVLPSGLAEPASALRHVSASRSGVPGPDPQITGALAHGSVSGRRLRLTYDRGDHVRQFDVDPWAVSLRHDRWYLLCWSHTVGERRVLRVDRVRAVEVLEHTFTPPADLDPVEAIDVHLSEGWGIAVEVIIDAPAARLVSLLPRHLGRLEPLPDGRTRFVGSTENVDWYATHLARLETTTFQVVSPDALRDAVRRLGERLLAAAQD